VNLLELIVVVESGPPCTAIQNIRFATGFGVRSDVVVVCQPLNRIAIIESRIDEAGIFPCWSALLEQYGAVWRSELDAARVLVFDFGLEEFAEASKLSSEYLAILREPCTVMSKTLFAS
jgi:hypothetical protein